MECDSEWDYCSCDYACVVDCVVQIYVVVFGIDRTNHRTFQCVLPERHLHARSRILYLLCTMIGHIMPSRLWRRCIGSMVSDRGNLGSLVMSIVYAGSKISAQLLCRKVTPIYKRFVSPYSCLKLHRARQNGTLHWPPSRHQRCTSIGWLTANSPTAVTTLLFSLSVKARSVDCAKLGSARVRPLPETCLGGILGMLVVGISGCRQVAEKSLSQSWCRTIELD